MKKEHLFSDNLNPVEDNSDFINEDKLLEIEKDVDKLLEIKTCRSCKKKKVIYYFMIDEVSDEYLDICIECFESNKSRFIKICSKCGKTKYAHHFYAIRNDGYTDVCKHCIRELHEENKIKKLTKVCTKCNKELPATNEYFKVAGHYPGFLENKCRVCRGLSYKEQV